MEKTKNGMPLVARSQIAKSVGGPALVRKLPLQENLIISASIAQELGRKTSTQKVARRIIRNYLLKRHRQNFHYRYCGVFSGENGVETTAERFGISGKEIAAMARETAGQLAKEGNYSAAYDVLCDFTGTYLSKLDKYSAMQNKGKFWEISLSGKTISVAKPVAKALDELSWDDELVFCDMDGRMYMRREKAMLYRLQENEILPLMKESLRQRIEKGSSGGSGRGNEYINHEYEFAQMVGLVDFLQSLARDKWQMLMDRGEYWKAACFIEGFCLNKLTSGAFAKEAEQLTGQSHEKPDYGQLSLIVCECLSYHLKEQAQMLLRKMLWLAINNRELAKIAGSERHFYEPAEKALLQKELSLARKDGISDGKAKLSPEEAKARVLEECWQLMQSKKGIAEASLLAKNFGISGNELKLIQGSREKILMNFLEAGHYGDAVRFCVSNGMHSQARQVKAIAKLLKDDVHAGMSKDAVVWRDRHDLGL